MIDLVTSPVWSGCTPAAFGLSPVRRSYVPAGDGSTNYSLECDGGQYLSGDPGAPPTGRYSKRWCPTNPVALRVKLADIGDNLDPVRLSRLPADVQGRLRAKYAAALEVLLGARDPSGSAVGGDQNGPDGPGSGGSVPGEGVL